MILRVIFLFLALVPFLANAGLFGPSNYDACLLENMKSASSPVVADEMKKAWARQFPKTVPLDELEVIVHVINSGELMTNAHYKAVHTKYYSDLDYENYLRNIFGKKDRSKYPDIAFEQFQKLIGYKR